MPKMDETFASCIAKIKSDVLPKLEELDEKAISTLLYDVASSEGKEPKALFTQLYKLLIGKEQGPRLAGFMKIIGAQKLKVLFEKL